MSKNIIEYKESFLSKIKNFFRNLFAKKELKQDNIESKTTHNIVVNNNFKENIEIKRDEEATKIINLQKEYKAGNIKEEDMTDDEHKKLIELYKKQNEELIESHQRKMQDAYQYIKKEAMLFKRAGY